MAKSDLVLLAVDPYANLAKKMVREVGLVRLLAGNAKLQPTYVLGRDSLNWDGDLSPVWLRNLKTSTFRKMAQMQDRKLTSEPMVLVNNKTSIKSDVDVLCKYAEGNGAKFIVLNTHARKGLSRFLLGSFTESVLLRARLPLLLFNPKVEQPKKIARVFVALEMSRKAQAAFKKQLSWLKTLGAEVILYNKMLDPIEPVVQTGVLMAGGGWVGLDAYRTEDRVRRQKQMDAIAADLKRAGLKVRTIIDDAFGTTSERVLKKSRDSGAQLIVIGTQVGTAGALIFGSVARAVARDSRLPVFVYPIR